MPNPSMDPDGPVDAMLPDTAVHGLPTAQETAQDRPERKTEHCRHLVTLWFVVTALWTAATVLRIDRAWVPRAGWDGVLQVPWLWLSLGAPPVIFALVFTYVCQVIRVRQRIVEAPSPNPQHEEC